jgi:hypothetical protein
MKGDTPEVPPLRLLVTHRSLHAVTAEVVEAAQEFTDYMISSRRIDSIDLSTPYGRVVLALTDRVTEYEFRAAGMPLPPTTETADGPVTLW